MRIHLDKKKNGVYGVYPMLLEKVSAKLKLGQNISYVGSITFTKK